MVDYAAEPAGALHSWFGQLADFAPTGGLPLRILLLERQADPESGWLQTAFGSGVSASRVVRAMLDPARPIKLPGIALPEHRRAILDAVFAKRGSRIHTPAAGADPDFDQRLEKLTWGGEPLFLMMAALLAAESSLPQVLALPRTEIAHKVAEREIGRVRGLAEARGLDADLLEHMAAYVTLCQGLARGTLLDAIETAAAEFHWGLTKGAAAVANALSDALPGTRAAPEPIRPDALGEAVVLQALDDPEIESTAVVMRAFEQKGGPVAAFVIRAAQDFAGTAETDEDEELQRRCNAPLAWLDALGSSVDIDQLMPIADQLPKTRWRCLCMVRRSP